MNPIWIALAAFLGGVIATLLGWLQSGEPFNPRKFISGVVKSLIAGVAFAAAYEYKNAITVIDLFIAFCGGAGVEALGTRIAGAIRAGVKK